ncbi:MAG: response regulator [Gemmataceae bacterium]|nr:response regulator [Gemmataceae bacterium]
MTGANLVLTDIGGLSPELLRERLERAGLKVQAVYASVEEAQAVGASGPLLLVRGEPGKSPSRYSSERVAPAAEVCCAAILAAVADAVLVANGDGRVTTLNPAAEALTGWHRGEAIGRPLEEVLRTAGGLPPCDRAAHPATLRHRDGPEIPVEISCTPVRSCRDGARAVFVVRDVSERRRLEEALRRAEDQLQQAQKLEAVGRLAGGVAHDINNMMTIIMGYGEAILSELAAADPLRGAIEEMRRAGERSANITRQLVAFCRKQASAPARICLNHIVRGTEKMLRWLIGEDVQLVAALDPALGSVKVDPGQMEQVLLNLAINARDAMPQGGTLTIETHNLLPDEVYAHAAPEVRPGNYVMLAVTDTGVGMDESTRLRLFEPFFTTKPEGKGTGIGMATVYGIVKQSGGHICVASEPNRGTTFKIYLPRATGSVELTPSATVADPPRGTETVLLAEDDSGVRGMAASVLRHAGYTVLEASDGIEALRVARAVAGPIHLLLTDAVMPHLSGRVLAEQLSRLRPDLKILVMSGYTVDSVLRHGLLAGEVEFIQKPFATHALAHKVRAILDAPVRRLAAGAAG